MKTEITEILQSAWVGQILKVLFILLFARILWMLSKFALNKLHDFLTQKEALRESENVLRLKTLVEVLKWAALVFVWLLAVYMLLENFGINVAPLLAGAGIVGLAFGFGGQYLIRDLINGIFILLEGQYRINDVVQIGNYSGLVESVNLRITQLRDLEGRVIFIPNGEVKTVINFTKDYAQAVLTVGVGYKENVDRIMGVIKDLGKELRKDPHFGRLILDDLEMLGVDSFADSQLNIQFRIKTLPIKQWDVAREFRRRLKNRFDELGIQIPLPQRTIQWIGGHSKTAPIEGEMQQAEADQAKTSSL